MINSTKKSEYYQQYCGVYISRYLAQEKKNTIVNLAIAFFVMIIALSILGIAHPIFAKTDTDPDVKRIRIDKTVYTNNYFTEKIKTKYKGSSVTFVGTGIAHIKKIKYINSKPVKINIVELNTKVNPNLRIVPKTANTAKLNARTTIRRIAQEKMQLLPLTEDFFKPQTGVPLGALMIDREILTGPIYNRVGLAIFENNDNLDFKLANIDFKITANTPLGAYKIDNINQPRMLSTYSILYSDKWGQMSPAVPKNCWGALIVNKKIVKISANPIEIPKGGLVLTAPIEQIKKLAKAGEINIKIELNNEIKEASHIIGAGPYLVKNSQIYVDYKAQKLAAILGRNPRSAIGYASDGTFIIVTVDGREENSVGMNLFELANLMKSLGAEFAMNFDGGSSSAMYVKGRIVNHAVNKEGIGVSNALIVSETNPYEMQLSSL